jgi:hypothetical protein
VVVVGVAAEGAALADLTAAEGGLWSFDGQHDVEQRDVLGGTGEPEAALGA